MGADAVSAPIPANGCGTMCNQVGLCPIGTGPGEPGPFQPGVIWLIDNARVRVAGQVMEAVVEPDCYQQNNVFVEERHVACGSGGFA